MDLTAIDQQLREKTISYMDLQLMLEAYKNQIELNAQTVSQQARILEAHAQVMADLAELCQMITDFSKRFDAFASTVAKEHAGLRWKLYVSWGLPAALIVSLVGAIYQMSEIVALTRKIAVFLGVGI